jgi:hypothetical protein
MPQAPEPVSIANVQSSGRSARQWRVRDRLSVGDVDRMVAAFHAGVPKHVLADRFGVSLSSVKRLLRKRRPRQQAPVQIGIAEI